MVVRVKSNCTRGIRENGSVFLEFAISAGVFMAFLIGSLDIVRVFQVKGRLQMATDRVARLSALGAVRAGKDRKTTIEAEMKALSGRDNVSVAVCPATARPCTGITVGGEKEWMYVSATTQVPLVLSAISITLKSESLVRNEPVFRDRTISSSISMPSAF